MLLIFFLYLPFLTIKNINIFNHVNVLVCTARRPLFVNFAEVFVRAIRRRKVIRYCTIKVKNSLLLRLRNCLAENHNI